MPGRILAGRLASGYPAMTQRASIGIAAARTCSTSGRTAGKASRDATANICGFSRYARPDDMVAIPTEIEWEWAASRGWTGRPRAFPWGDDFDDSQCLVRDFSEPDDPRIVHFGGIPVGFFALDRPPDGPADMAGNVWDWVTSLQIPWNDSRDRERPGGLDKRGVRGSSWFSREPMATHVSFRLDDPPCNAYWDLGFRVAARAGREGS